MSRTAVLSDIHGNLPALQAVIADAEARGCTRFLNLGDSVSGPLWPAETADLLIARDWPTIAGNHERQVLASGQLGSSDAFAAARLPANHMAWVAALPPTLAVDGRLLCHGTPSNDVDHLLFSVDRDGLRAATEDEIVARCGRAHQAVLLCGHTHMASIRHVPGRTVVNPGSVGLQAYTDDRPHDHVVQNGDPRARYALFEGDRVMMIAVEYDYLAAAAKASDEGFADWAQWLATGRVNA